MRHSLPAECPAVVGYGDEEAGGDPVDGTDLASQQCHVAAEAHGADAQLIGGFHDVIFQLGQLGVGVDIIHGAEQLLFGQPVARRPIAADAYADKAGAASLSLGLVDAVQNALSDAVQVPACPAQPFQFAGEAVLDVLVFTSPSLEDQTDFDFVFFPLLIMDDGCARSQVVSGVFSGQGIDRVWSKDAPPVASAIASRMSRLISI